MLAVVTEGAEAAAVADAGECASAGIAALCSDWVTGGFRPVPATEKPPTMCAEADVCAEAEVDCVDAGLGLLALAM